MGGCSPAFLARDIDKQHFEQLLAKANPEKHFYVQFLKQQLEFIDTARKARELCESDSKWFKVTKMTIIFYRNAKYYPFQ